jgi:dTDP-4-amino-4,6-dideoxygalactose transaminase
MDKIPFIRPTMPAPERWLPHLAQSYAQRMYSNSGPAALRLEAALTAKYGAGREAVLLANATAGLTAALMAAGVRGSVLVPAFTFSASAHAILQAGCTPVFCDVAPDTWELTPEILERALSRTRLAAVMPVRAFGLCRDIAPLVETAGRHGLPVILDSAAALGGRLESGTYAGGQGLMEVFSLHATKVFGVGEGGVLFCTPEMKERVKRVCNFGQERGEILEAGLNGKMSEFHAAVGLAVLEEIDQSIAHRQRVAARYREGLYSLSWLHHPEACGQAPYQTYPLLVDTAVRVEQVVAGCAVRGVELRRYYRPALHLAPAFAGFPNLDPLCAEDLASRMLCLPIYSDMNSAEQERVLEAVTASAAE